ncbi:ABC transporter permease [Salinibacterium sp. NG253]|uniref:ABC transporter permease n=1 Tax=Salinibacterium sp. NG253 TaxID=2792039 RepID=UPI0018CCCDF9|nr:ABC transporter permease [Salinibacterium sp. NG253]MBH0117645.1 ABC transporter permease [Salinibacterium sp. NG253]
MTISTPVELIVAAPGRKSRGLAQAIARRIGIAVIVIWGAITASFLALKSMGGDPVQSIAGGVVQVTPELREQIIAKYGLDDSFFQQYLSYLGGVLQGDLGTSYALRRPVVEAIAEQLPNTMTLLITATVFAVAVAFIVSLTTAHRGKRVRSTFQALESIGVAVPAFWLGIMLITIFSFGLRMFPSTGANGVAALVLPSIALGLPVAATLSQVMRDTLEKTLDEPFIVTVRARGAGEFVVRVRHALRHSLVSVITLVGWLSGTLIGGAVVVEQVFSRPGIGRMIFSAVLNKDMPVVLGIVIVAAVFYVIVNTVIDLLYPIIDPRLR